MNKWILLKALVILCFLSASDLTAQQWGDYTLYSIGSSNNAYLLDTNGTVAKTWTFTSSPTGYSTYMLPGGSLLRTVRHSPNSFSGGGQTGKVQKVDWNGKVVWDYVYSTSGYSMHHDICPMPNGNVLLIAYESKTAAEATEAGCSQNIVMWPEKIVEIQPTGATTGTVVWEWHVWDHLVQNVDPAKKNYQTSIVDHPELLNINYQAKKDWMHMNGIDYNPILDQIVVSSHNLNEWYVIDHSTTTAEAAGHTGGNSGKGGDFLYRWGNPAAYGASGTKILKVTHDAHWIPEGVPNAGYLVGFNNQGVSTSKSAVDQISPPVNGYNYTLTPGSAYAPATYTKRHECNGYSSNMSNSQQLPNGNMLVCVATSGLIYETDPAGKTIWSKTVSGTVAQSFRYSKCYAENEAPPIPVITENAGVLTSNAATTYQWYFNGAPISGATGQSHTPTQSGIYLVRVTDSKGCIYSYSKGFKYSFITAVNTVDAFKNNLQVFPNPATGIITLRYKNASIEHMEVLIYDSFGKVLLRAKNASIIDLSSLANGVYFLKVSSREHGVLCQKITLIK